MTRIDTGSMVHSCDTRDDPETFYVVVETNINTLSGPAHIIAIPGEEEFTRCYRLARFLSSCDSEIAAEVAAAERYSSTLTSEVSA
jgi:hypothetical protein